MLASPLDNSYYRSSILLKGQCSPQPEAPEEIRGVKTLSWRIDALGDYDNSVFMEEDGSFELDIFTSGLEGEHSLILKVEDFAGVSETQTILLNDGNQAPRITLDYPAADGQFGSMLGVKGNIRDLYKGIEELEGIKSFSYRLISRDRDSVDPVLTGLVEIDSLNVFTFALDMAERSGRQSLYLEAEGNNASVGTLDIDLSPGTSDIPSFTIKAQDGRILLDWDPVPGSLEQTVFLTDDGSIPSDNSMGNSFPAVKSPLTLSGVQNGSHYRARLRVDSEAGVYWSDVVEAVPLAPGTLELTAEGRFEQILLKWKSIPGASAFRLYRREENEKDFTLLDDHVEGSEYVDAAVEFGRNYYYRIEPSAITGPLSYEVPAAALEAPSEKITMSSHYRNITPIRLTVEGEYAYVAAGDTGFYIMDVSTPQKPEEIGHLDMKGVKDVYIEGEYAYLASGSRGFSLVNISEPTRPFTVLTRVTDDASGIIGQGNTVFVADGERGLQIFDISRRQEARRISSFRDFPAYQLALKGQKLYVASGSQGLKVLDVSILSSPILIENYDSTPVLDVFVRDNSFYLACGEEGMIILEENSSGRLQELSRFRSSNARMVRLWEDYAMIADGTGGMKAVDISLPERPQLFGSFPGNDTSSIAMAEDYALIADISGLKVVRTYLYGQSVHELSLSTAGKAYGLLLEGSNLWVADRRGGVAQYDVSQPRTLSEESLIRIFPSEFAEDILLKDGLVFIADGPAGIKVYDRNSSDSEALAAVAVSGRARRLLSYGEYLLAVTSGDGLLFLKEREQGELSLKMVKRYYSNDLRDAAFYGSYLFAGDYEEGLIILDAEDVTSPIELARLSDYRGIRQLLLKETVLYVLHKTGISLLDIKNPEHPVLLSEIKTAEAEGMQFSGSLLYVAEGYRGISIYRINEQYSSLKVSDCEDIFAVDVAPSGAYAFYADMDGIGVINVLIPQWLQD